MASLRSAFVVAAVALAITVSLQGCNFFGIGKQCSAVGQDCTKTGCCSQAGMQCYVKNQYWASCKSSCTPGIDPEDPPEHQEPWACTSPGQPVPSTEEPTPAPVPGWVMSTWTTGYWDCCKPSCSWIGRGSVDRPPFACDIDTGDKLKDGNTESVCHGGRAASCTDNRPFRINNGLSMGFAAVNAKTKDEECGKCFELRFTNQIHHHNGDWGGAAPGLQGKAMIVQVTNIGGDVTGKHSFDIQIPGAGQGIFDDGCTRQFDGYDSSDFDCGNKYGGCDNKTGCDSLPKGHLQEGCKWRYDWYDWKKASGTTNNPYVTYRRVKCPEQLVKISGSTPTDDEDWPSIDPVHYKDGTPPIRAPSPAFVTV